MRKILTLCLTAANILATACTTCTYLSIRSRRRNTGTYWLMYHPYAKRGESDTNFGFSETTDFVHFDYKGRMNEDGCPISSLNFDMPNHGTVIQIPAEDAKRLARHWKYDYNKLPAADCGRQLTMYVKRTNPVISRRLL